MAEYNDKIPYTILLRAILYNAVKTKSVCEMMFLMAEFVPNKEWQEYLTCCLNEVFRNYRFTCRDIAQNNLEHVVPHVREIAKNILEKHEIWKNVQQEAREIPDLQPSDKRRYLRAQVQYEKNIELQKASEAKSILSDIFQKHTMKYGNRTGYFFDDGENKQFNIRPYVSVGYSIELADEYSKNPRAWSANRVKAFTQREEYLAAHT